MLNHNKSKEIACLNLSQVDLGRKYLKSAIEKGQEKDIVSALHNIIDAILWDINNQEHEN